MAQDKFWYLDTDNTTVIMATGKTRGSKSCAALAIYGKMVKTITPLNCSPPLLFEELSDSAVPPMLAEFNIALENDSKMIFQNCTIRH